MKNTPVEIAENLRKKLRRYCAPSFRMRCDLELRGENFDFEFKPVVKPPSRGGTLTLIYGRKDFAGYRLCCLCGKRIPKGRREWCSAECVERWKRDSLWSEISQNILDRDGKTCRDCGTKKMAMEVHHVKPVSKGGTNDPENLITLCWKCHKKRHGKGWKNDAE